jgi:hypothetical protein
VCLTTSALTIHAAAHGDAERLEQTLRARGVRAGWAYGLAHLRRDAACIAAAWALAAALGWAWVRALGARGAPAVVASVSAGIGGCIGLGVYCVGVGAGGGGTRGGVRGWFFFFFFFFFLFFFFGFFFVYPITSTPLFLTVCIF